MINAQVLDSRTLAASLKVLILLYIVLLNY